MGTGRYPSPVEAREVLTCLGFAVTESVSGFGTLHLDAREAGMTEEKQQARVAFMDYGGDDGSPQGFYFSEGRPEINGRILARLAEFCGPLVMMRHDEPAVTLAIDGRLSHVQRDRIYA